MLQIFLLFIFQQLEPQISQSGIILFAMKLFIGPVLTVLTETLNSIAY